MYFIHIHIFTLSVDWITDVNDIFQRYEGR